MGRGLIRVIILALPAFYVLDVIYAGAACLIAAMMPSLVANGGAEPGSREDSGRQRVAESAVFWAFLALFVFMAAGKLTLGR